MFCLFVPAPRMSDGKSRSMPTGLFRPDLYESKKTRMGYQLLTEDVSFKGWLCIVRRQS